MTNAFCRLLPAHAPKTALPVKWITLLLISLLSGFHASSARGQPRPPGYHLGIGMLVLTRETTSGFARMPALFGDSLLTTRLPALTHEGTTCPTCMECAEPTSFYKGPIQPFSCDVEGMQFICTKKAAGYLEIIINKRGKRAYLKPGTSTFYTWNGYMRHQASLGDYFMFVRQWDRTVLYDQPYDLRHLPRPNAAQLVGLKIPGISDLKFYPVLVKGYWMKLRFKEDGQPTRYAWFVWRTETEWRHGFQFRSLD